METLPEPYLYVRTIVLGLGALWTIGGIVRTIRFGQRWRARLKPLGMTDAWLRGQLLRFVLRITVLDPVNLALAILLVGLWSLRAIV